MGEVQDAYPGYTVQSDVALYILTAYIDQESEVPTGLLGAVARIFSPLFSSWNFRKLPTSYTLCVMTVSPGISVSCPVQCETSS